MTFDKNELKLLVDILSDHWQHLIPEDNQEHYDAVRALQDRIFAEYKGMS